MVKPSMLLFIHLYLRYSKLNETLGGTFVPVRSTFVPKNGMFVPEKWYVWHRAAGMFVPGAGIEPSTRIRNSAFKLYFDHRTLYN